MAKENKDDKTYFKLVDWDSKAIIGETKWPKKPPKDKEKGQKK